MSDVQQAPAATATVAPAASQGSKFVVTKSMINGFISSGLTVPEMAEKITEQSGHKCSEAVVRNAAKAYDIKLRNKPKKSPFAFEAI